MDMIANIPVRFVLSHGRSTDERLGHLEFGTSRQTDIGHFGSIPSGIHPDANKLPLFGLQCEVVDGAVVNATGVHVHLAHDTLPEIEQTDQVAVLQL